MDTSTTLALESVMSARKIPGAKNLARRRFVRFAAEVREDMRRGAPRKEGTLRKAVKSGSTRSGGAKVFVDKGKAPHWYMSGEGGTKERKTKKGAARGRVKQKQWIEPARARAKARFRASVLEPAMQDIKNLLLNGKA
jgi:hypothetical protein